jgi:hypothetical protein
VGRGKGGISLFTSGLVGCTKPGNVSSFSMAVRTDLVILEKRFCKKNGEKK